MKVATWQEIVSTEATAEGKACYLLPSAHTPQQLVRCQYLSYPVPAPERYIVCEYMFRFQVKHGYLTTIHNDILSKLGLDFL